MVVCSNCLIPKDVFALWSDVTSAICWSVAMPKMNATGLQRSCCVRSSTSGPTSTNVKSWIFVDVPFQRQPMDINLDSLNISAKSRPSLLTPSVATLRWPPRMRSVHCAQCWELSNGQAFKPHHSLVQQFPSLVVKSQLQQPKTCVMQTKLCILPKWTTMLDSNFGKSVRFQIWFGLQWVMLHGEYVVKATAKVDTFSCLLRKKSWMVKPPIVSSWIGEVFVYPEFPEAHWMPSPMCSRNG